MEPGGAQGALLVTEAGHLSGAGLAGTGPATAQDGGSEDGLIHWSSNCSSC